MRLSPEAFDAIRKAVHELCGIVIAEEKHYLVVSRLEPVLTRLGLPSYEAFVQALGRPDATPLRELLIEAITTRETSFNRDGHPFEELRRSILPELSRRLLARRAAPAPSLPRCRIWCAAAATGQEAYSVAMAISDFLASRPGIGLTLGDFPILATDICQGALAIARAGRYSAEEVRRGVSEDQRARYFSPDRDGWFVAEPLRRAVEFRRLNLVLPLPNLGTFDLILCRNLLIYLDDVARRRLCLGLHQALNPSGLLIIGAAESLYGVTDAFATERFGSTIAHRKT
ncbi:CheR family methyltransferase [Tautonia marina]|uniref:CheR family methyltransferase n=1 Tax=Tautonia marina TaxID=2653855 RepID=UPI0012603F61|nr:protein-glutamate O-methyltransferase CheR [Tautonia marina]